MNLYTLFNPTSIAIVGASENPQKIGHIVLKNIQEGGYKGKIAVVNPKGKMIRNIQSHISYQSLSFTPDLAILCIPADLSLLELPNIAQKGTKNVLIYSAGFKEIEEKGAKKELELKKLSEKLKLNILGPNCLGFVNNNIRLNATFSHSGHSLGNLSFISQSGAIASALFDWFDYTGIGFDQFITIGNKTCIGENDILDYFCHDHYKEVDSSRVRPIGLYLESIQDGVQLTNILAKITPKRPVFILKPGKSESAQKAMQSHTGAIAGEDKVFDAAMKQFGVIRCEGMEDIFDLAKGFSWEDVPDGPEIAVISNAGGPAVITADFITEFGLSLAKLSFETKKILQDSLPRTASIINPIDVLGDALVDRYENALQAVLKDNSVKAVVVLLTPQIMTEIDKTAEVIGFYSKQFDKPIFCSFIGGNVISNAERILNSYRIPNFRYPERSIKILSLMWKWNLLKKRVEQRTNNSSTTTMIGKMKHTKNLSSYEAMQEAEKIGLTIPITRLVKTKKDVQDFSTQVGYPIVLKISSPNALHKTDINGVIPNITSESKLISAYHDLLTTVRLKRITQASIIAQQHILNGIELIIGCKRDPSFGPLLTIGTGGILTELLQDHVIIMLPSSDRYIHQAIKKLRIYKLIEGFRSQKPYDIDSFHKTIDLLSTYFLTNQSIFEIEINPLILTRKGAYSADVKIIY